MAYSAAGLSKVSELGVNGCTLWCYFTLDSTATVAGSGYYTGSAPDMLRVGDIVLHITVATGTVAVPTTVGAWGLHIIATNDGTTVTTSALAIAAA